MNDTLYELRISEAMARTIRRLEHLQTMLPAARCDDLACAITALIENAIKPRETAIVPSRWGLDQTIR